MVGRSKSALRHTAGALIIAFAACGTSFGQGVTGTVSGVVKDQQGGVVPGVTVTLINETQGTQMAPVVTNTTGDFVVPNVAAGTYTVQVEMPSFRTVKLAGIAVSPGSRLVLPPLTLEVGGASEQVMVTADAPLVQAASGEKSFTIATESVTSLPLANRSYDALLGLMPGVNSTPGNLTPASRLGGGGDSNFMLDGATAMDPGVNRPAMRVSVEAISEVRVATSTYQAEYGRSSGLQVNAVTKSGTNQFRGAIYDVERNSKWNANSRTNILNGDPKAFQDERDWGFAIGGPVGRPGGSNKLFFYYNQEFNPRRFGNTVNRYRVPTLLERQGDFSQTTDNLGNPYPYIKDPLLPGACNASTQAGCFAAGGVVGRIPPSRLYQTGLNILKWWPAPNISNVPPGQNYNYESVDAPVDLLGYQPVIRVDYQPIRSLRGTFKFLEYQQPTKVIPGTIPGFNDTREDDYGIWVPAATVSWSINTRTFAEASWGANYHHQEGCSVVGGEPNWCRGALPVNDIANRFTAGFGDIPYLFPDANILDPRTFSYEVVSRSGTPVWDGTRVHAAPSFQWGNRVANAPPNNSNPWNNFILDTASRNLNVTLTRVQGRHTIKTGYYYFKSYQRRGQGPLYGTLNFQQDAVGTNPCDTSFGFSNAATGCFSSYSQQSRWGEGAYTAINHEGFVQDNWKVTSNLTLDYGVRLVRQLPQYDAYLQASNFLPETWRSSGAPQLYVAGCANGVSPCTGTNRQARHPITGQFLGPNSTLAIGTLVPNTGSRENGIFPAGQGIAKENGTYPALAAAPRFGIAWDVTGEQRYVVRGGAGLFYDRPQAQNVYNTVNNPPFTRSVTVRYGQLQNIGATGLTTEVTPALTVWQYDMPLPTSAQWNVGVQTVIPFSSTLDVSYTGQHSYNTPTAVNINAIDLGAAFLPQYADPTQPNQTVATSYVTTAPDLVRFYRGYGAISQQQTIGWRTYHSIQVNVTRRFKDGFSLGFADTIQLSDKQQGPRRLQHNADGTITLRDDQAEADRLLGNNSPQTHIMRGNFVWQLPKITSTGRVLRTIGYLANDWSLSGIWSGATGAAYTIGFTYQSTGTNTNVNLTGSPDYAARVRVVGDPGAGCSSDPYRQFTTGAFQGPIVGSTGLESGSGYVRGCFISSTDLAIARTIRLGSSRSVQLRVDLFNAFNQAGITNRITAMALTSPANPVDIQNLPFDANGNLIDSRSRPRGAGFGVASGYQAPRTLQLQARLAF